MLCKEILGGYGVSFRIRGFKAGGLSHRLSPEYGRRIVFRPGKHVGESILQGIEFLRILCLPFLDQSTRYEIPYRAVSRADLQECFRIVDPHHFAELLRRDICIEGHNISQIVLPVIKEVNLLFREIL